MKKISPKAVLIGSVTDIVATNLVTFPFMIYVVATRNLASLPKDQVSTALLQAIQHDPILFSVQLLLGSLCSVLGGYVAARIAKQHEVRNGAFAAILCVIGGVYGLFVGSVSLPLWQYIAGLVASPALSGLGGYIRLRIVLSKPTP